VITIPVGVDENGRSFIILQICSSRLSNLGVPFGLAIMHKASREDQLIRFSSAIEHLVNKRPSPTFLNPDADDYLYIGAGPKEDTL
jgi:Asp-tRNA(Asn)/Glu-tRNA(Gln) amidotransferase A subunit family amidase